MNVIFRLGYWKKTVKIRKCSFFFVSLPDGSIELDNLKKQKPFFFFLFLLSVEKDQILISRSIHLTSGNERRDSDRRKSSSSSRERRGFILVFPWFISAVTQVFWVYKKQTKEEEAGPKKKLGCWFKKKIRKHFYPNPQINTEAEGERHAL